MFAERMLTNLMRKPYADEQDLVLHLTYVF